MWKYDWDGYLKCHRCERSIPMSLTWVRYLYSIEEGTIVSYITMCRRCLMGHTYVGHTGCGYVVHTYHVMRYSDYRRRYVEVYTK